MSVVVRRGNKVLLSGRVSEFKNAKKKDSGEACFFLTLDAMAYDENMGVDMPCKYHIGFFDRKDGKYGPQSDATYASKMIKKTGGTILVRANEYERTAEDGSAEIAYNGTQIIFPGAITTYKLSEDPNTGEVYRSTAIYSGVAIAKEEEKDGTVLRTISIPIKKWNKDTRVNDTYWLNIENVDAETIKMLAPTEDDLNSSGKPRHKTVAVEFNKPIQEAESMMADWADKKTFVILEKPKYEEKKAE